MYIYTCICNCFLRACRWQPLEAPRCMYVHVQLHAHIQCMYVHIQNTCTYTHAFVIVFCVPAVDSLWRRRGVDQLSQARHLEEKKNDKQTKKIELKKNRCTWALADFFYFCFVFLYFVGINFILINQRELADGQTDRHTHTPTHTPTHTLTQTYTYTIHTHTLHKRTRAHTSHTHTHTHTHTHLRHELGTENSPVRCV